MPYSFSAAGGALLVALVVGGCAPDAFLPDAPYEGFLNRIQSKCLYQRIGRVEITSDFLQTPYFLDLTSRFYNGEIPQAAFVENLHGLGHRTELTVSRHRGTSRHIPSSTHSPSPGDQ